VKSELEQFKDLEALHKDPTMKATFHEQIALFTLWRFCVYCGERIERGGR